MGKNPVQHFEMYGDDPQKLADFYSGLFDWKIEKFSGEGYDYWMVYTVDTNEQGMPQQSGGINGGIAGRMSPDQKAVNYVTVESVEDYLGKARGLGATMVSPKMEVPGMGYFAHLLDPEGNLFGIWENIPQG